MAKPLTNLFLHDIFSNDLYTRKIFKGFIYPRGNKNIQKQISNITTPALYICNTDFADSEGLHWLLVLYLDNQTIFFDPFGLSPDIYNYPFLVERSIIPVTRNIFTVQNWSSRSVACGHFVLIYGLLLARGYSLNVINNIFHPADTESNDTLAIDFILWLKQRQK